MSRDDVLERARGALLGLAVGDDPVTACDKLAPHIVATHFNDRRFIETAGKRRTVGVPLGQGVIDLPAILAILVDRARPGTNITLEVPFAAQDTVQATLEHEQQGVLASVRYAREILGIRSDRPSLTTTSEES